jgi:hypothetical protein
MEVLQQGIWRVPTSAPAELARLSRCANGSSPALSRHPMHTLDVQRFAQATSPPSSAADSLTIAS